MFSFLTNWKSTVFHHVKEFRTENLAVFQEHDTLSQNESLVREWRSNISDKRN